MSEMRQEFDTLQLKADAWKKPSAVTEHEQVIIAQRRELEFQKYLKQQEGNGMGVRHRTEVKMGLWQEEKMKGTKTFGIIAAVKKQYNELDKMDSVKEKLLREDMRDRAITVQKQLTVEHITEEQVEAFFDFL